MNKYEEALKYLNSKLSLNDTIGITKTIILQELVERATSTKVIKKTELIDYDYNDISKTSENIIYKCPNKKCDRGLHNSDGDIDMFDYDYCPYCGQALDWSD